MFPEFPARWIVAHRGVSDVCPENTQAAFDAAVACSSDAIEFDVQLTGDDQVVVCHDTVLDRYGHKGIQIAKTSLRDLQQLDIGSWFDEKFRDQRLMSLDDLLSAFGRRIPMLLEIKASELSPARTEVLAEKVVALIRTHSVVDSVAVLCFDVDVLKLVYRLAPELKLVLNSNEPEALTVDELCQMPWLQAVDGRIGNLTPQSIQLIHQAGLVSSCFTCNDAEDVMKAWDIGVAMIITNHPDRSRQILKQHGRVLT